MVSVAGQVCTHDGLVGWTLRTALVRPTAVPSIILHVAGGAIQAVHHIVHAAAGKEQALSRGSRCGGGTALTGPTFAIAGSSCVIVATVVSVAGQVCTHDGLVGWTLRTALVRLTTVPSIILHVAGGAIQAVHHIVHAAAGKE